MTIRETLETPEKGSFDVVVCGGGVGGAAAAAAAARKGKRVLLLEKSVSLGGLATVGLISWYEPLCDGRGRKMMYGMTDELFRLALRYGPDTLPEEWKGSPDTAQGEKRLASYFSPMIFAMALDRWLLDAGVTLLLDSVVAGSVMENGTCRGVIVENKGGRCFYGAKMVIDTTGDADVLVRSGVPCECGSNYLTYCAYVTDGESCQNACRQHNMLKARKWVSTGSDLFGKGHPEDFPRLSGTTAEEVTEFVLAGRKMFFDKIRDCDRFGRDVSAMPSMAQLRTTRRLCGAYELTGEDTGRHFDDSVGAAGDFTFRGRVYELPYRILYHKQYGNLFTAGRSVSASGWAWDVTRVIPVAVATGQAAGTAAALCIDRRCDAGALDVSALQKELADDGVNLKI